MKRILITGISGFSGIHLTNYLVSRGEEIFGIDRKEAPESQHIKNKYRFYASDICDTDATKHILLEIKPDIIFHFAALIKSTEPVELYKMNVLGTLSLFESIIRSDLKPRFLLPSSSALYGPVAVTKPITESSKIRPMTHYAISKATQESVAFYYHRNYRLPVYITRTFNLIGPGQSPDLACSFFARQIALFEQRGKPGTILTGNLDSMRDFIDIRDAVRAYDLIITYGKPGAIYNVCSGVAVSIRECLEMLMEMSNIKLDTSIDPRRLQSNDLPVQVGTPKKLERHTGWNQEISLRQSLMDLLNDWRVKTKRQDHSEKNTQ